MGKPVWLRKFKEELEKEKEWAEKLEQEVLKELGYKESWGSEWYALPATVTYLIIFNKDKDISEKYFNFLNNRGDYFTSEERSKARNKITSVWRQIEHNNLELKILRLDEYDKIFSSKSFFQNYASLSDNVLYTPECIKCEPTDVFAAAQTITIQKTSYPIKVFTWPDDLLRAVLLIGRAPSYKNGFSIVIKNTEGDSRMPADALKVLATDAKLYLQTNKN